MPISSLLEYRQVRQTIKNKVFDYGNKRIKFDTDRRAVALGNVALTSVGKQLYRIVPMEYDDRILEICLDTWQKLGYNPIVENMNNNLEYLIYAER